MDNSVVRNIDSETGYDIGLTHAESSDKLACELNKKTNKKNHKWKNYEREETMQYMGRTSNDRDYDCVKHQKWKKTRDTEQG